ncbi:phosphate ABC transporter substrate-binding protein PstS [Propionimicrobium sp. PCR01-08-3]|uniref:phosphate ABC transporter substrate-binding protein PstS n=1 Tax=Propionimicrobium sp. PCR01-08-3 TaxID=3052086 RepID=UPI00255C8C37|nr:phosphate ABC transporter substrate-binding protein PstS [Propionimicrobium sp. PCR01-08-3]WIY82009.1 phosphate ABC transporter substrate-binding protein PstS [Propionimicrobium sp. PCR01-08-3]
MKTVRAGAALAAVAALALSACATNETDTPTSTDSSGAASNLSGTLQGTGASSAKAAQEVWRANFQSANPGVTVNYSPDGSGAGRTAFADGGAAFAGSDRALNDDEMSGTFASCAAGSTPLNLPIYVSPIAITFNLEGIDELHLDADVIAKIFRGEISNWNDPAIAALNSGVSLPDLAITPVHRSDNSGTTENFTATLAQVAPDVWTDEASGDWPASLAGEAAQGTSGVVAAVQNGSGTIGYADESGLSEGMSVALYSQDGSSDFVGPEADAAAAIIEASAKVAGREDNDWALELDRTAAGYPFVLVSYAIACQEYADASVGELVNAYIGYVVSDQGQQDAIPQAGNAPLSGELAAGVQEAAASIK